MFSYSSVAVSSAGAASAAGASSTTGASSAGATSAGAASPAPPFSASWFITRAKFVIGDCQLPSNLARSSSLEGMCARLATENITEEQLEELEENVYLASYHASKGHMEQMAELDNRFHHILYEACDSKMLQNLLQDFHQYVMRVRRKTLSTKERGIASNEEHKLIMEAIKAKNADEAEKLANQHMNNAYDNMVKNGLYDIYK